MSTLRHLVRMANHEKAAAIFFPHLSMFIAVLGVVIQIWSGSKHSADSVHLETK